MRGSVEGGLAPVRGVAVAVRHAHGARQHRAHSREATTATRTAVRAAPAVFAGIVRVRFAPVRRVSIAIAESAIAAGHAVAGHTHGRCVGSRRADVSAASTVCRVVRNRAACSAAADLPSRAGAADVYSHDDVRACRCIHRRVLHIGQIDGVVTGQDVVRRRSVLPARTVAAGALPVPLRKSRRIRIDEHRTTRERRNAQSDNERGKPRCRRTARGQSFRVGHSEQVYPTIVASRNRCPVAYAVGFFADIFRNNLARSRTVSSVSSAKLRACPISSRRKTAVSAAVESMSFCTFGGTTSNV